MIDPEQLSRLAAKLAEHSRATEILVLGMIAKRLKKGLESQSWAALRLAELSSLNREVRGVLRQLNGGRAAAVNELVASAGAVGAKEAASLLHAHVQAAPALEVAENRALLALARDLAGRLSATDRRVLRSADDIYRQVIARVTAQGLQGEFTRRTAAQAALDMFADHGVTGFVDNAGKRWSLASYTEMATRTAANQAARQGMLAQVRDAGRDLVVIGGSHSGCDLCAPWEGEVLSLDGKTPGYATLAEAEAAGLFHPNCGHQPYPYVPGLTDVSGIQHSDPDRYEALQDQRRLERGVRQWKRREVAAMDDTAKARAVAKQRDYQAKLRQHTSAEGLRRKPEREQIKRAI